MRHPSPPVRGAGGGLGRVVEVVEEVAGADAEDVGELEPGSRRPGGSAGDQPVDRALVHSGSFGEFGHGDAALLAELREGLAGGVEVGLIAQGHASIFPWCRDTRSDLELFQVPWGHDFQRNH